MEQEKSVKKKWYKPTKVKVLSLIIVALIGTNIYSYALYNDAYYEMVYYHDTVPHLDLEALMLFYGVDVLGGEVVRSNNPNAIANGSIVGFVTFPNRADQPRGAWQYYEISSADAYDDNGNQIFLLQETIKMPILPPREFDMELLSVTANTNETLTLETESGQTFRINKRNDEVTIIDSDGDISRLITNDSDYTDFMMSFLGYK